MILKKFTDPYSEYGPKFRSNPPWVRQGSVGASHATSLILFVKVLILGAWMTGPATRFFLFVFFHFSWIAGQRTHRLWYFGVIKLELNLCHVELDNAIVERSHVDPLKIASRDLFVMNDVVPVGSVARRTLEFKRISTQTHKTDVFQMFPEPFAVDWWPHGLAKANKIFTTFLCMHCSEGMSKC